MGAPIEYSAEHKGYYYSEQFSLPFVISSDNDESLYELVDDITGAEMTAENTGLSIKKLTFIDYSPFALFFIPVVESPATIVVSFTSVSG